MRPADCTYLKQGINLTHLKGKIGHCQKSNTFLIPLGKQHWFWDQWDAYVYIHERAAGTLGTLLLFTVAVVLPNPLITSSLGLPSALLCFNNSAPSATIESHSSFHHSLSEPFWSANAIESHSFAFLDESAEKSDVSQSWGEGK